MATFNQNILNQIAKAIGATKNEVSSVLENSYSLAVAAQTGCDVYCPAKVFDNGKHGKKGECTIELPNGTKFKMHKNGNGLEIQKTFSPYTLKHNVVKSAPTLAGKGAVPQFLAFGKK